MRGDGLQHLCQHFGWGGYDVAAFEPAFVAAHIGYDAARFLYDQCAGGDIPGFEVEFEEAIEAAAGHGTQIELVCAFAAVDGRLCEEVAQDVQVAFHHALVHHGEAGADQAAVELDAVGYADAAVVEQGALAA